MWELDMADIVPVMTAFFGGLTVLTGAFLGAFFKYMAIRERSSREERKQQEEAFATIIEKLGGHIDESTEVQRQGNIEAAERNGHLGEQNIKITELVIENKKSNAKQYTAVLSAISDMKEQHVKNQRVDKQTVVHETVKNKE